MITIMNITWICPDGHEESASEDLGDKSEIDKVDCIRLDIKSNGCRRVINGLRCGKLTKTIPVIKQYEP